jgi:hypothetical protein
VIYDTSDVDAGVLAKAKGLLDVDDEEPVGMSVSRPTQVQTGDGDEVPCPQDRA